MSIQYRPEIDGLRAISVVAVVLYHAGFTLGGNTFLPGGFIGVDIFFVISGYLICKIILREIGAGQFTYANFYHRRARRILPALFLMMLVSLAYAWSLVLPKEMKELAGSGLSSLLFGSNFWFWQEDSYTAAPSLLKPFLHTWSLSVEEQFYLVFPVIVLLGIRFGRNKLGVLLIVLFSASLMFAEFMSYRAVETNFFLIPTRAWELLAGSLIAANEVFRGVKARQSKFQEFLPMLGLIMIVTSFFVITSEMRHPSLITLIPVLGCVLIIQFGSCAQRPDAAKSIVIRILSSAPLTYVGLISYSLYLWHYPVFAFARIKQDFSTIDEKFEGIAVSIVLAIVSYYLAEKPLRDPKKVSFKPFVYGISVTFALLGALFAHTYYTQGANYRVASNISDVVDFNYWKDEMKTTTFSQHPGCWLTIETYRHDDPFQVCRSAEINDPNLPTLFIIGDSHAASLIPGLLDVALGKANVKQRVRQGCLPVYERMIPAVETNTCYRALHSAYQEIRRVQPDVVVIAGAWRGRDAEPINQQLNLLKNELSSKIVLVGPLVYWAPDLPAYLKDELEKSPLKFPEYLSPDPNTFLLDQELRQIAKKHGVGYISPARTFCAEGRCKTRVGGRPSEIVSYDNQHLTEAASIYLMNENDTIIKKVLQSD